MQWDRSNSGFKFLNGGPTCSADNYHVKPGAGASAGAGAGGGRGSHSMADEGQENIFDVITTVCQASEIH